MLVSPSIGNLALLSVTANLGSLTFGLRGSVKQSPAPPNCTYAIYIYMHFSGESHSFHCLLKFVKRLKTAPLLPLPISLTHIHRLNNYSHLDDFQFCRSGPEFSKPSPNCLLPSCLWMPHKHLQLNLCKIKHSICPQQFNVLLLYSLHQLLSHPENPKVILDSSLFPLSTFLTHPLPPYTLP